MIGQIEHRDNIESIVNYHYTKIKEGVAEIINNQDVNISSASHLNTSFRAMSYLNKTKKPYVHMSINFHPDDKLKLTDDLYKDITKEYLQALGYSNQPYVLIRHDDQDHPHVHVITSSIKYDGTKVSSFNERYISRDVSRDIELKHDLKIVSSIRQEINHEKIHISGKNDLKNYLQSSIKEALSYKPKREEDLFNILKEKYQIGHYITQKKAGACFYLSEKKGGKDIQIHNGFGVKAMSASKIRRDFSYPKLKTQLQENFKTAPKRYRNLKLIEEKINNYLEYFDSISIADLNIYANDNELYFFNDNSEKYVLDENGKNVFSNRDIQTLSKVNKDTTVLSQSNKIKLYDKIYEEAFYAYKQEMSPDYRTSTFLEKIFKEKNFSKFIDNSRLFNYTSNFISLENFRTYESTYVKKVKSSIDSIVASEDNEIAGTIKKLKLFSEINGVNTEELINSLGLNDLKRENSINSSSRNTIGFIEKLLHGTGNLKGTDAFFNASIIHDYSNHFSFDNLSSDFKDKFDYLVSNKAINSMIHKLSKEYSRPKELLKALNDRGILASIELNKLEKEIVKFSYIDFETKLYVKNISSFLLNEVKNTKQNQIKNLNDISFITSIESEYKSSAYSLYSQNKVSKSVLDKYNIEEIFSDIIQEKENIKLLNKEFNLLYKDSDFNYKSDFLLNVNQNFNKFKEDILSMVSIDFDTVSSFLEKKVSLEEVSKEKIKEQYKFNKKLEIHTKFKDDNLGVLLGLRSLDNGISDIHGKYYIRGGKINENGQVLDIINSSLSNYHSHILFTAINDIYFNEKSFQNDIYGIVTAKKVKGIISEPLQSSLQDFYSEKYINHFLNKLAKEETAEPESLVKYLNSKGILIKKSKEEDSLEFKIINSNFSITYDKFKIDHKFLNEQLYYISKHEFFNEETLNLTLEFSVNLEKESFKNAAFMIIDNPKLIDQLSLIDNESKKKVLSELKIIENRNTINQALNLLYNGSNFNYKSDFLSEVGQNLEDILVSLKNTTSINSDEILSFLREQTSEEFILKMELKESQNFDRKIDIHNMFKDDNLSALIGLKSKGIGVSDTHGKYYKNGVKLDVTNGVKELIESPLSNYNSHLLFSALNDIYFGEKSITNDIYGIITLRKIEGIISESTHDSLDSYYSKVYINNFLNKIGDKDYIAPKDVVNYLNSKGIIVYKSFNKNEYEFKVLNSKTSVHQKGFKINNEALKSQLSYFSKFKLSNKESLNTTLEFSVNMEKENYKGAAFMLFKNPKLIDQLHEADSDKKTKVLKELKEMSPSNYDTYFNMLSTFINNQPNDNEHQDSKIKKKKKRNKKRNIN